MQLAQAAGMHGDLGGGDGLGDGEVRAVGDPHLAALGLLIGFIEPREKVKG